MTIDIRSMGYARVASTNLDDWKQFGGKVLGLAEGRGPNPDNLYFRIDEVSARLSSSPPTSTSSTASAGSSPTMTRSRLLVSTWPRPVSRPPKALPRSWPSAGSRSSYGSPIRSATSSSCSTASPTSRAPS